MTKRQMQKLDTICDNYVNGNKRDAAQAIKALTKLELFYLVTTYTRQGDDFSGFIERVLTKQIFND